jgi:hypothetical protein
VAQNQFFQRTHYDHAVKSAYVQTGVNINNLAPAVQEVVWSMSAQHGNAGNLISEAINSLKGRIDPSSPQYSESLINALYASRSSYVTRIHKTNLLGPLAQERENALRMLGGQ